MPQQDVFNDYSKVRKDLPKSATGINLITYPIALEAWRRGIELSFYSVFVKEQVRIFYSLKNDDQEYNFQLSFGGVMHKDVRKIVNSKDITKHYLETAGVPVPKGKLLNIKDDFREIFSYASLINYPVVIKPLNAKNATGVFTNLKNDAELETAIVTLRDEFGYTEVIVEQYVKGDDTRVYVIEDKVIAAFMRRPANVIGDGINNINNLIIEKNEIRQKNPHLKRFMIEINDKVLNYLNKNDLSLESIPNKHERVFLNDSTLHPDGCETVDITDNLTDKMKMIAVDAVKAVPGMKISGIDIMMNQTKDEGFVLELNASPNLSGHLFPMEGQIRDVPKAFIDYHFPETKKKNIEKYKHFSFDFDNIIKHLKNGTVEKVTVPALPAGELTAKEFRLTGEVDKFPSWIHRKAVGKRLGGQIVRSTSNQMTLKVAGKVDKVERFTELLINRSGAKTQIKIRKDIGWNGIYFYYFKPVSDIQPKSNSQISKLKKENEKLIAELRNIKESHKQERIKQQDENHKLNTNLKNIKNSRSWKLTQPLRTIQSKLNRY